jgi:hypothetical protein
MTAQEFFKDQAKKANLSESIIYVYDTVIISIMEDYAALKVREATERLIPPPLEADQAELFRYANPPSVPGEEDNNYSGIMSTHFHNSD